MEVSLIIPVYNSGQYLIKAVNSALLHSEIKEIILVEDGSKDDSYEICQKIALESPIIKLLRHENGENKGAGATRNLGILNATKDYISFLDADDTFTEIRFLKEKKLFNSKIVCDGVYGAIGVDYLDDFGRKKWERKNRNIDYLTTVSDLIPPTDLFEYLIGYNRLPYLKGYFSLISLTVKREKLLASGVLFDESLRLHQDTVFIIKLAYKMQLFTGEYSKPIALRGVHSSNRFLNNNKISKSRSLQFEVLRNWAIKEGLPLDLIKFINKKYLIYYVNSKSRFQRMPSLILKLIIDSNSRYGLSIKLLKRIIKKSIYEN